MKKIFAITLSLMILLSACGKTNEYIEPESILNSATISLYGKEISLPTPVKSFVDLGFRPVSEYGNVDGYSGKINDYKVLEHENGSKIEVYVANYYAEQRSFESCYVIAVKLEPNNLKTLDDGTLGVILPNGMTTEVEFSQMVELLGSSAEISSEGSVEFHTYYGSANAPSDLFDFANTYRNEIKYGYKGTNLREVQLIIDVFE